MKNIKIYTILATLLLALGCTQVIPLDITETPTPTPTPDLPEGVTVDIAGFDMVLVPGGTFTMGATSEQEDNASGSEKPAHQVTVSDFYIGKYEVTQDQWITIMGSNPSAFIDYNSPVEKVSWYDVQEFITKLNAQTGKNFRLPTEAEWEYAARGGSKHTYYKYSGSNTIDAVAWYKDNSNRTTHPIGQKKPNTLGIYDMSGNVCEWCSDWYGSYSSDSQINPTGPEIGSYRVLRGGSWSEGAGSCHISCRYYASPETRNSRNGFRLACPADGNSGSTDTTTQPNNEIWYTSTDGKVVNPRSSAFKELLVSNTYTNGKGVIRFDADLTEILDHAFAAQGTLASVTMPNSVTTIGIHAFNSCVKLESITLSNSLTTLGNDAFFHCTSLTSITIPSSVTTIGYSVFNECDNLAEFKGKFASADGRCLIIDGTLNSFAPYGLTSYTISNDVTAVGDYAFYACNNLTSVTIHDSVIFIGNCAFDSCSSLVSVYCYPKIPPQSGIRMFSYNPKNYKIYVPSESVDAYKAADGWKEYADVILADPATVVESDIVQCFVYGASVDGTMIGEAKQLTRASDGIFTITTYFNESGNNTIFLSESQNTITYPYYALAEGGIVAVIESVTTTYSPYKVEANGLRNLTVNFNSLTWSWERITNQFAMPDSELVNYPTKQYIARDGSMKTWMVRHMAWDGGNIYPKLGSGMVKHSETGAAGTGGYAAADFPTTWNDTARLNPAFETAESGFGTLETYSDDGRIYTMHEMLGYEARNGIGYARYESGPWYVGEHYTDARGTTYTIAEAPLKAQIDQYTGDNAKDEELYPMLKVQAQGICPYGWHVANASDWLDLFYAMAQASKTGTHTYPVAEADCTYKQMINGGVPNINGWLRNTKYWGTEYIDEGADEFGFDYYPLGFRYMTQGFQCWSMRCQMRVPLPMAGAKPVEYPSAAGGRINVVIKGSQSMTAALANIDTGQSVLPFRCVKNY